MIEWLAARRKRAAGPEDGSLTRLWLILTLIWTGSAGAQGAPDHRIGAGDMVAIEVFGEQDLSPKVKVGDRGTISYPFLGELQVAGLTTRELQQRIHDGLKGDYLIDPKVSVTIAEYRPFYVNGEVRNPGAFAYESGMTVRKAVSLAGGMTDRASSRKIFLVSESSADREPVRVDLDHPIGPGDTLTIQQSFF